MSKALSTIFESMKSAIPPYLDEERLLEAFTTGWRRYFETVWDVVRYLNAFDFNYARARDEVDIGDLAAITALQVAIETLRQVFFKAGVKKTAQSAI